MSLTLTLPLPPNLANGRGHWRVKNREKRAYMDRLTILLTVKAIPTPPATPLDVVTLDSTLYLWAHMDDDNALARLKYVADWLVRAGYLVDDKRPHCRFTIPTQVIDRADQRLTITITEAA